MEENEKLKIGINSENDVSQQNGNAEVKPKNKKLTIVLVSVIIVLLIAIGVCVGLWFAGDTTKIINNKEEVVKEEENTSKKLDETKPWVYDADYGKDKAVKKVESFSSDKDLTVPYININSEDANKANDEIKNIYEETYSKYGSAPSYTIIYSSNYEFYENDNILSIVLRVGDTVINGGAGTSKTYIYNFNLDTLKKATLKEMAILCGFNSELDVQNKVKEWEKRQNDLEKANPDKVAAQMTGVVDGQYFIDKDKKLKFIYMSLAAGNYYTPAVVEPNKEIEDFYDFDNDDNSATGSIQDFSIMKNAGFANTVYQTEKRQGEKYYKVSFDSNCNPTIYIEDVGVQPYATYRKFYNIKSDVAAGTTYITFDFKILNKTEDGGKGEIKYSNVADNTFISIKLNYPPTDYVTLQKATTSNNTSTKNTDSQSKVYAKYYMEKIKQLDFVNDSTKYGLLYINQSDIPYLVVDTSGDLSIYKINNNTVETLKERDSYGTHGRDGYDYIEGTKIMRDYCTFEEGYAYEIYDELFNYKYCVECTFNGEYRYSNNSGDKKTITEEEFDNLSYKNSKFKHLRDIGNKNKEEMIKFLENQ